MALNSTVHPCDMTVPKIGTLLVTCCDLVSRILVSNYACMYGWWSVGCQCDGDEYTKKQQFDVTATYPSYHSYDSIIGRKRSV
jgi:hypothetical protein